MRKWVSTPEGRAKNNKIFLTARVSAFESASKTREELRQSVADLVDSYLSKGGQIQTLQPCAFSDSDTFKFVIKKPGN